MADLSFQFEADGYEPLAMDDMGEGSLVLSQADERGRTAQIAVDRAQLVAALAALDARYGDTKNTDRGEALATAA